jgi:hypothetical protein
MGLSSTQSISFLIETIIPNRTCRYLDRTPATNARLVRDVGMDTYLGVDFTTPLTVRSQGRASVRIETKKRYQNGLFIVDLKHMPSSTCGTVRNPLVDTSMLAEY